MKQSLEIRSINIQVHFGKSPQQRTIHMFASEESEKEVLDILHRCSDSGFVRIEDKGKPKEVFQVKQILYKGVDWDRFENYDSEGHEVKTDFNTYVMDFETFKELDKPKKIYIDFYRSISLTE